LISGGGREQVSLGLLRCGQVEPGVSRERVGLQALLIGGCRLRVGLNIAEGVAEQEERFPVIWTLYEHRSQVTCGLSGAPLVEQEVGQLDQGVHVVRDQG